MNVRRALLPNWGRRVVTSVCGYELVALNTRQVPTITEICKAARRHPLGFLAIVVVLLVLAHHLLIEE